MIVTQLTLSGGSIKGPKELDLKCYSRCIPERSSTELLLLLPLGLRITGSGLSRNPDCVLRGFLASLGTAHAGRGGWKRTGLE